MTKIIFANPYILIANFKILFINPEMNLNYTTP